MSKFGGIVVEFTAAASPINSMSSGAFAVSPCLPMSIFATICCDVTDGGNTSVAEGAKTAPIMQSASTARKGPPCVQGFVIHKSLTAEF